MTSLKTLSLAALAALTLGGVLTPAPAEARGRGVAVAAGVIGGLTLGAIAASAEPERVYVRRVYVKKHRCGCRH